MSYRHIKLNKIKNDTDRIEYRISSPDFSNNRQWEDFGIIELHNDTKSFTHRENDFWTRNKIYPIELFGLNKAERIKLIKEKYADCGSGMWAMSIYEFIIKCFSENSFPEEKILIA